MTKAQAKSIIEILDQAKGDDLERAKRLYGNRRLTVSEQRTIDIYTAREKRFQDLIAAVNESVYETASGEWNSSGGH